MVHNSSVRYKDVKPENVLYVESESRFLWADFGLAYGFGFDQKSQTYDLGALSNIYAAPKILWSFLGHGRSSDVFSLSCIFIRILAVLIGGNPPEHLNIPFRKKKKIR